MHIAEVILHLGQLRRRLDRDALTRAIHIDVERLAGMRADDALHVSKGFDLAAVDRDNQIAGLEARGLCGARRLDRLDARGRRLLAVKGEYGGEDTDGENEVGDRSCRDDCGALGDQSPTSFSPSLSSPPYSPF